MAQYLYAFNSSGKIVLADSLVGQPQGDTFTCVSCEKEMIARVNGAVQTPHFAHKVNAECSGETYLHKTAKEVFATTYRNCVSRGKPFYISFSAPRVCKRYKKMTGKTCDVGDDPYEYDLTQSYTIVRVEKKDGEFIPDVSLHSKFRPENVIYIEIAVSSFLSEEKKASGKRIIEIPIKEEEDIIQIRNASISEKCASFLGFTPKIGLATDSECKCRKDNYFAFYLFRSGKCFLNNGSLESIRLKLEKIRDALAWKNFLLDKELKQESCGYYCPQTPDKVFIDNLMRARDLKMPFKNCNFCQHHTKSYSRTPGGGRVFCKLLDATCNSNAANNCSHYSQSET